jgi:hypothetical protein
MLAIAHWAGWSVAAADTMRIRLKMRDTEVIATLLDNATSRDLVAQLPLRLTLEDYGDVEKIGYLPKKLSTDGAPAASTPSAGDLSYYAPWGNLAFFRKGFRHSPGLIRLGKIETGMDAINATGRVEVLMERAGP